MSDSFVTPWTIARQAPLSMGFSRQEYWSGLPWPPPGDRPHPGMEPASLRSPAVAGGGLYQLLRYSQLSAGALCCRGGPMGVECVGSGPAWLQSQLFSSCQQARVGLFTLEAPLGLEEGLPAGGSVFQK